MEPIGFLLFQIIGAFISAEVQSFVSGAYTRLFSYCFSIGSLLFFIHIVMSGYKMVTGEAKETFSAMLARFIKMSVIISILGGTAFANTEIHDFVFGIRDDIIEGVTGKTGGIYSGIDSSIAGMNTALYIVDAVTSGDDPQTKASKSNFATMAVVGQATPAIVAGTLALMNDVAMRLAIMLAPVFLLCLMFQRTQDMFYAWLKMTIASSFSLAVLSLMIGFAQKLVIAYSAVMIGISALNISFMTTAMMQAGLGIVLSTLFIGIPPMVGKFFGGAIETYGVSNSVSGNGKHGGGNRDNQSAQSQLPRTSNASSSGSPSGSSSASSQSNFDMSGSRGANVSNGANGANGTNGTNGAIPASPSAPATLGAPSSVNSVPDTPLPTSGVPRNANT